MRPSKYLAFIAFVAIFSIASASSSILPGLTNLCTTELSGSPGSFTNVPTSAIGNITGISLLIVLLVFTVLGLTYGVGIAFGIESLRTFTKTEALEGVLTVAIIVFVSGGLLFAGGAISFLSNLGLSGLSSAISTISGYVPASSVSGTPCPSSSYVYETSCGDTGSATLQAWVLQGASVVYDQYTDCRSSSTKTGQSIQLYQISQYECPSSPQAVSFTSSYDVYNNLCSNFINTGVNNAVGNAISPIVTLYLINALHDSKISLAPNGVGVVFEPFFGTQPEITIIGDQLGAYFGVTIMYLGLSFMLIFIYAVFPFFLYAGVLLRSLPWTRAAGGSLIAFFFAFYILFPALLYPFSISTVTVNGYLNSLGVSAYTSYDQLTGVATQLSSSLFGIGMSNEIAAFAQSLAGIGVTFLGVIIAIVVCFDFVEVLGDLLGAPSLHSRNLLSKVI
ncbi:MAG: hypothetical protein KGI04_00860 [Candidatus Micrarchaeota archaeon]|nr:hypothetical protein [Candidatus Micrarchaeota archaeon]